MTAYIEYLGAISVRRYALDAEDLRNIGEFTRENIVRWFNGPHRDWENWVGVCPVEDFHAVCGSIDLPWATEEGRMLWAKLHPPICV